GNLLLPDRDQVGVQFLDIAAIGPRPQDGLLPDLLVPARRGNGLKVVALVLDAAAQVAFREPRDRGKYDQRNETKTVQRDLLAAQHVFGVARARDQALLAKNFLNEKVPKEIRAVALPYFAFGQVFHAY